MFRGNPYLKWCIFPFHWSTTYNPESWGHLLTSWQRIKINKADTFLSSVRLNLSQVSAAGGASGSVALARRFPKGTACRGDLSHRLAHSRAKNEVFWWEQLSRCNCWIFELMTRWQWRFLRKWCNKFWGPFWERFTANEWKNQ
jgi:hypothetical protein